MKDNKKIIFTGLIWLLYIGWILFFASTELSIINFVMHILFLGVIIYFNKDYLIDKYKEINKKNIKTFILYFGLLTVVYLASNVIVNVLREVITFNSSNSTIYDLFSKVPFGTMFAMFLTIFFYPIVEEIMFRKSLRDVIKSPVLFVIISSLLAWYFQVTLINPQVSEFVMAVPSLIGSVFCGFVFVKKDNIYYSIIPRMLYNVLICLIQIISL